MDDPNDDMARPWNADSEDREWVKRPSKPFDGAKRHSDIYNTQRWRNKRKIFLARHPLCVECERNGMKVTATVADHIQAIAHGGDPWDENNLQPLCRKCHSRKTNREIAGRKK